MSSLVRRLWSSTIQARSAHVSMPPWNCSAVLDGQLYANSRRHWSSISALCHSAQVDRTALPTERFRSSAFCCCGPVDLEFAAWQHSWPRAESQHFQALTEDIHFYEILTTKRTKRIRYFLSIRYINLHFIYLLTNMLHNQLQATANLQQIEVYHM